MKRFLCAGEGCVLFLPVLINKFFQILAIKLIILFTIPCVGQEITESDKQRYIIPPGGVVIGETVPEWFWELKFRSISHPKQLKVVHLKDYKDKLLVIDFWAAWCKPCVKSVDKWDELHQDFKNEVGFLALHAFESKERGKSFVKEKNWKVPVVEGPADSIINRLFYTHYKYGQVWIKDNKLIAIPVSSSVNRENIIRVIMNLPHQIEMHPLLTYFDPRYKLEKGEDSNDK